MNIYFSDDTEVLLDDVFETEEATQEEFDGWLDSWAAGAEVLELMGRVPNTADIEGRDIYDESYPTKVKSCTFPGCR